MRRRLGVLVVLALSGCSYNTGITRDRDTLYITGNTLVLGVSCPWVKRCHDSGKEITCEEVPVREVAVGTVRGPPAPEPQGHAAPEKLAGLPATTPLPEGCRNLAPAGVLVGHARAIDGPSCLLQAGEVFTVVGLNSATSARVVVEDAGGTRGLTGCDCLTPL